MNSEVYPWDTKQQQRKSKPYGFIDFQSNLLSIFREKREKAIGSLETSAEQSATIKYPSEAYLNNEFGRLFEFSSPRVIVSLHKAVSENETLNEIQIRHFWRILKKVEVRKLTFSYNSNFINTNKEDLNFESKALLSSTFLLYSKTKKQGHLQALSTSLKLNDFLIAEKDNLTFSTQSTLLTSLQLEQEQISTLLQEIKARPIKNIALPESYKKDPPIRIKNLGMLLQETNRSKAYIQILINSGFLPNFVLLLRKPEEIKETLDFNPGEINTQHFNPLILEEQSLKQAGIPYKIIRAESCNEEPVVSYLRERPEQYFIFSGRDILKEIFKAGKKLIHSHPGKLPNYRGSTCPYYSALAGDGWHCTSLVMKQEVDEGEIIAQREFPLPPKGIDATRVYDPYTRAEVMLETIKQLTETGTLKTVKQNLSKGITYYIIHPVLEFIAKQFFANQSSS